MKFLVTAIVTVGMVLTYGAGTAQASVTADNGISPTTNAGFVMTPPDVRSVSADWTVPTVSCNTPDAAVRFAVELADAYSPANVTLGVDVDCKAGVPSYAAWFHPQGSGRWLLNSVHAGDAVEASLKIVRGGVSASFFDNTRGWGIGLSGNYALVPTQAGVVVSRRFGENGLRPLASFGTLEVTSSKVNGHAVTRPVERVQMRPPGRGRPQVRVSNLDRPAGGFTATWLY